MTTIGPMFIERLLYVEWGSDGKVRRIVKESGFNDKHALDKVIDALEKPHILDDYDVNWCKRDQDYYINWAGTDHGRIHLHQLADGNRCKYWAADHAQCYDARDTSQTMLSDDQISALGYDRVELATPPPDLTQLHEEISCSWCDICNDMLPEQDPCDHLEDQC